MDRRRFLKTGVLSVAGVGGLPSQAAGTTPRGRRTPSWGRASGTNPGNGETWSVQWHTLLSEDLAEGGERWGLAGAPDRAVLATDDLVGFSANTGAEVWRVTDITPTDVAVADDTVIVGTAEKRLRGYSLETGERVWDGEVDPATASPLSVTEETITVVGETTVLVSGGPHGGRLDIPDLGILTDAVAIDGVVHAAGADAIAAYGLDDGDERWRYPLERNRDVHRIAASEGVVCVVDRDGGVLGLAPDGQERWERELRAEFPITVVDVLATDGSVIVQWFEDGPDIHHTVSAFEGGRGVDAWTYDAHSPHLRRDVPRPRLVHGTVWAVTGWEIVGLATTTGDVRRRWRLPDVVPTAPLPLADRMVVVDEGSVYGLGPTEHGCTPPAVRNLTVEYTGVPPEGNVLLFEGRSDHGDCTHLASLEVQVGGRRYSTSIATHVDDRWFTPDMVGAPSFPAGVDADDVTATLRGTEGTAISTPDVEFIDRRAEPRVSIHCGEIRPNPVPAGKPVTVIVGAMASASAAECTVALEVDGEVVRERIETVPGATDVVEECHPEGAATSPQLLELTHTFEEAGAYNLRVTVSPVDYEAGATSRSLGTVEVTGGVLGAGELAIGGGAIAALGGAYWRWGRD